MLCGLALRMLALFCSVATSAVASAQEVRLTEYSGPCIMAPLADAPLYHVAGRVVDDMTGAPVAGATVSLDSLCAKAGTTGRDERDHFHWKDVTDEEGKFSFEGIPAMGVRLAAAKDDYLEVFWFRRTADDPIDFYVIGPKTRPFTLRIAPAASISGVVRDEAGAPIVGAWVGLERLTAWAGWRRLDGFNTIRTEADGSYRFDRLPPGRYFLVAQAWLGAGDPPKRDAKGQTVGFVPLRAPALTDQENDTFLELTEGEQRSVDFQFHRELLHHITGTVSGGGIGLPPVNLVDRSGSASYFLRLSFEKTSNKCCELEAWLPSGSFRLESGYGSADGNFAGSMDLRVADADISGTEFVLRHPDAVQIPIQITNAAGNNRGEPCPDADAACGFWYLQLIRFQPNGYVEAGPQSTMSGGTQRKGAYRSEDVTVGSGTYAVAVETTGNVYARSILSGAVNLISEPLVVTPGVTPDPIRIVLAKGATAEGIIRRGGKPAPAWVYAIPEQPDARLFQPTASGPDGRFHLQGLAPGPYLFFATDVELSLDIHDPRVLDYWRQSAQARALEAGSTAVLQLQISGTGN